VSVGLVCYTGLDRCLLSLNAQNLFGTPSVIYVCLKLCYECFSFMSLMCGSIAMCWCFVVCAFDNL
jgi:hypothetical protein